MTSTPYDSEALDRLVAPWAAKIAKSSGTTVEAIVANAENVRAAVQELEPHGRKARQLLAARAGLSRPMMSKLETIGHRAQLLRGGMSETARSLQEFSYAIALGDAGEKLMDLEEPEAHDPASRGCFAGLVGLSSEALAQEDAGSQRQPLPPRKRPGRRARGRACVCH
jgi:hypothetical protein